MPADIRRDKVRINILDSTEEKEHFHQDIELIFLLEGTLNAVVNGQKSV